MKIIPPSFEVLVMPDGGDALRLIEPAGGAYSMSDLREASKPSAAPESSAMPDEAIDVRPEPGAPSSPSGPSIFCGRDQEPVFLDHCASSCAHRGGCPDYRNALGEDANG